MPLKDLLNLPDFKSAINCADCAVFISNDTPPQIMTLPPGFSGPIDRTRWTETKTFPTEYAN